jgi:phage terminase large subunit GpA-like protein
MSFSVKEKVSWKPLQKIAPSEWAEKHRTLTASIAAESGQLRLDRTPYMREIIDCIKQPGIEEICFVKPTQIGWSTNLETLIGYFVDNDPGPTLLVYDSQKSAQEVMDEKIRPLIEHTPNVKQHLSPHAHDNTLNSIKFDTMPLFVGWAGSPASLARRAIRYCLFDEVDKYPNFSGREADPVSLGTERTATFGHRRRVLLGSTPTVRTGPIWRAWEASGDKRTYYVPCPHCGTFQQLVFTQIKYPKLEIQDRFVYGDKIEQGNLAHYECSSCLKPVLDHHRPKMLLAGRWLSEGQSIDQHGTITGDRPKSSRIGFRLSALYSPWRSFSAIAAEHRRSLNDPGRMQNFKNSWLAEPFEEQVTSVNVDDVRKLVHGAPKAGIIPKWAEFIITSADVQKDRLYWVCRAWGPDCQSQLIAYGMALTFEELRQKTLHRQWSLEDSGTSQSHLLVIDSGYRTNEVYEFARTDERIRVVKGDNDNQAQLVKYSPAGKAHGVTLWYLNTQLFKDRLAVYRTLPNRWLLNDEVQEDYLQQIASEHKVFDRNKQREFWQVKSSGAANHILDCEIYNLAGAEMLEVHLLQGSSVEDESPPMPMITTEPQPAQSQNQSGWLGNGNGSWISGGKGWL